MVVELHGESGEAKKKRFLYLFIYLFRNDGLFICLFVCLFVYLFI